MNSAGSLPIGLLHPVQFLKEELAPYPGRLNLVLRVLLSSTVVIVTSLTLEVPILMLSLLVVLAVTQSNLLVSRLVGVLAIIAVTLAVGITILLYKFTYDYPLLRILAASALFYGSVYMMRAATLGPVFFIIAIVVIFGQTFVDQTEYAELLVRALLWVWVAIAYPVMVGLVINTILLPVEPQDQFKAELHRQLQAIDARLAFLLGGPGKPPAPITLPEVQKGALTLQKLLKFATMRDKRYKAEQARYLATVATVSRLNYAASDLPQELSPQEPALVDALGELRRACGELDSAIANDRPFVLAGETTASTTEVYDSAIEPIVEMEDALQALSDYDQHPPPAPAKSAKLAMLVPDAFTNPVYHQFALKTLLATLITYIFYTAADWQGIHTCMLTIIILAQSSFGAVARKAWLRIFGAVVGSLIALFMIVFVIPHIDGLVGVLMMTLPVIAVSSWMMGGSERISYAGFQILVTFGLALLMDFGPTMNLTEVRDRMIGVLLGVVVYTVVSALLWPESEGQSARNALAELLKAIGKLLAPVHKQVASAAPTAVAQQQLAVMTKLGDSESILARVALEPRLRESEHEEPTLKLQTTLAQARSLAIAVGNLQRELVAHRDDLPAEVRESVESVQEQVMAALDAYAEGLRGDACQSPVTIPLDALEQSFANAATAVPEICKSAILSATENVVLQLTKLPSWSEMAAKPTNMELSASHA